MATNIPIPKPLNINENLSYNWKVFKRDWKNYEIASKTNKEEMEIRVATFLACIGSEAMNIYDGLDIAEADAGKIDKIISAFDKHCIGETNETYERFAFNSRQQLESESVEKYVTELRKMSKTCNFENLEDGLLRDKLVTGLKCDVTRRKLLQENKLTLSKAIEIARAIEVSKTQMNKIKQSEAEQGLNNLDAISKRDVIRKTFKKKCLNCNLIHAPKACPAFRDKCHNCGHVGHWQKCCRKKKFDRYSGHHKKEAVNEIEIQSESEETIVFQTINVSSVKGSNGNEAFICLDFKHFGKINRIKTKIDTGAGGNTIPLRIFKSMFTDDQNLNPEPTIKLTSYSGDVIKCLGSVSLMVKKENQSTFQDEKFYIVDVEGPAILGLPACLKMNIVSIHLDASKHETQPLTSVQQLQSIFPNQFDKIGKMKEPAKLYIKEGAIPHCDAPRKVSIHLKPKIKKELMDMEEQGIIRKLDINEHSDWCSSLVYVTKNDGSLRICLDPKKLNKSLKRIPHKIPTTEEINPIFSNAKIFSKLDAKAGYWSVPLHEESQLLTTFRTPFGRYCWQRLPFGLNVSQDIFQERMDVVTEELEGVANIADDVAIAGADQEDHDKKLMKLMQRAAEFGVCFNSKKCDIAKPEITFFGNKYTNTGLKPDPEKIVDLENMISPQSKEDLSKILGLMTYLSPYIPNFSSKSEPLRALMREDAPFQWDPDHEHYLTLLKSEISNNNTLAFYDPKKHTSIEVDASTKGLGAALLQDDKPIAFASKALTKSQANYSNIEREALGLVHGIQRYHTYLYGTRFTALTDHKPLVDIWNKPLTAAPQRLQRMFLILQGYDMDLQYRPGHKMTLSDTLSRFPNSNNSDRIDLDVRVDGMCVDDQDDTPITLLNFTNERQKCIQKETSEDPKLRLLTQTIIQGWPDDIKQCHEEIREFYNFRETLAVENGIVFKGRQVVIPKTSQKQILQQLHFSHQGIAKTQMLARESVYWPGINKDIENTIKNCATCQKYMPMQAPEPSLHHNIPPMPWRKLASDLYQIGTSNYLIIVDYFSKFPLVVEMNSTTSQSIIKVLRFFFSIFGGPKEFISDNGPQFSSREFAEFSEAWDFKHTTSSPYHPHSNCLAERAVQTTKKIIKKCKETGTDISEALLHLRATPIDSATKSPGELMFGRPMSVNLLPNRHDPTQHQVETRDHLMQRLKNTQGKELTQLVPGQPVRVLDQHTKTWAPAVVKQKQEQPRSYTLTTETGSEIQRNRNHIRDIPTQSQNNFQSQFSKITHTSPPKTDNLSQRQAAPLEAAHPVSKSPTIHAPSPQTKKSCTMKTETDKTITTQTPNQGTVTRSGRIINKPSRYDAD